ncbi:MAG: glycosyltransferase [Cytophagales bacterium]|nr:MAG: glycosyltransferase [Cytophagales bacterium]
MKILHITNAFPYENAPAYGIFVKEQIEQLKQGDASIMHDVFFINGKKEGKKAYWNAIFQLRRQIKSYDLIHCHHVYSAFIALLVKPRKQKMITSFLSSGFFDASKIPFWISNRLYRWVLRNTDAKIFKDKIPDFALQDLSFHYLPNGVDTSFFSPMPMSEAKQKLNLAHDKKYLLFVSANDLHRKEKRYDLFQEIVKKLKEQYQHEDIEELHLVNAKRQEVPLYFNASHIHILTSDYEGSPNSVKEALSCNVAVVSTSVGNVVKMLEDIPNCYVSAKQDSQTMAELAHKCLKTQEEILNIDIRSHIFTKKLDNQSIIKQLIQLYYQLYNHSK